MYQVGTERGDHPLNQRLRVASFALLAAAATAACQASPGDTGSANAGHQAATISTGNTVTNEQGAINQRFRSLDEYLAWLEQTQGPVDGPWYKEVSPGIYELQTGNLHLDVPSQEKRTFTRAELAKKFGFDH